MTAPFDSLMLRVLLGPLVACLQIFALYVVFHGHTSPGGGFQGGVLLGASMILMMLVHGRATPSLMLSQRGSAALAAAGVLAYATLAAIPLLAGRPMLDYAALPLPSLEPAQRRWVGILIVEASVALAVAGVMVSLFQSLAGDKEVSP
ncbi:MAG: cation:proton antiporter [Planctomycetes bacterium]|nr:cation:proton antiporter [Planctomycetota bacterium]